MDPVQEGDLRLQGCLGRSDVGGDHHLFDELFRLAGGTGQQVNTHPVFVQHKLGLVAGKVHVAPGFGSLLKDARQLLGGHQALHDGGVLVQKFLGGGARQNLVDLGVHAPDFGVDHRFLKAVVQHVALLVKVHQGGEGELLRARVQGAHPVGQGFRQHGDHPVGKVHGGAPAEGLVVDGAFGLHVMGHVGDVDPKGVAVHRFVDRDGVVQVLGVGAVNGENRLVPQVQAAVDILLGHGHSGDLLRLGHDLRGKLRGNAAPDNDGVCADAGSLPRTEHGLDLRLGPVPPAVRLGLDEHLVPVLGAVEAAHHRQVIAEGAVGSDPGAGFVHVDGGGHGLLRAGDDPLHTAAGALIPLLQVGEDHLVPQKRPFQGGAGHKDVLSSQLGPGKAEPLRQGDDLGFDVPAPGHQLHPVVLVHLDLPLVL